VRAIDRLRGRPPKRRDEKPPESIPATDLLNLKVDILLQGPAGAGKTTTLEQLLAEALARDLLPITFRFGADYTTGTLEELLRRSLERAVEQSLAPSALQQLLMRPDALVLLDGAGELVPAQRTALIDDLVALRERGARARFVIAARDGSPFKRMAPSEYTVQALDRRARREIAAQMTPDGAQLVGGIEQRLGGVVGNPLLFTLAMSLEAQGQQASSRAELFDGFVSGLQRQREGTLLSVATRAAAEAACHDLRCEGRYSADRWWWLDRLTAARGELIARGTLSPATPAAEEQLAELEVLGLVRRLSDADGDLGLLHDLFCDWLASEAVRHGLRALPDPVVEPLEETVVFLAERGALDDAQLLAVAGNAVAATRVANVLPSTSLDAELADAIWQRLRPQLAPAIEASLAGLRLRVVDGQSPWACLAGDPTRDAADLATESPLTCLAVAPVSSLSIAVDLWLAALRLSLRDGVPPPPVRQIPDGDIVELLHDAVIERSAAVEELAARLLAPELAARLVRAVGPSGLWAWLAPPRPSSVVPAWTAMHTMWYIEGVEGFHVEYDPDRTNVPFGRTAMMGAEAYPRRSAQAEARRRVVRAFEQLLPRHDA
jgi:hypothetical protein